MRKSDRGHIVLCCSLEWRLRIENLGCDTDSQLAFANQRPQRLAVTMPIIRAKPELPALPIFPIRLSGLRLRRRAVRMRFRCEHPIGDDVYGFLFAAKIAVVAERAAGIGPVFSAFDEYHFIAIAQALRISGACGFAAILPVVDK